MVNIKTYPFYVEGNINQLDIDKLIELYQNTVDSIDGVLDKSSGQYFDTIDVVIEPIITAHGILAEIDPLFLGYLVLFLNRHEKINAIFHLNNIYLSSLNPELSEANYQKCRSISDRAFSLYDQISFISSFLEFGDRISLLAVWYKKETKEILPVTKPAFVSKRFFPTMLINSKASIKEYFNKSQNNNAAVIAYFKKVEEIANEFRPVKIEEFCAIEIFILRLLLSEDNPICKFKKLSKDIINYYINFSNQLALGIKELALNIIEHSRISEGSDLGVGVITGRIFERERLLVLKGTEEEEFLTNLGINSFCLDINVIDLGYKGIREKYIENILGNWNNDKDNTFKINYKSDIQIIQNKADFKFEDFYIPNTKTEHQLNKLISRYGLQYFTHILTQRFDAFVKVISEDENLILEGKKQEIKSYESKRSGTSYNCIIPFESFNTYYKSSNPKPLITTRAGGYSNLLIDLHKHNGIVNLSEGSFKLNELILFDDYPQHYENKYELIKNIYLKFLNINENLRNRIFLINAEKFRIENPTDWLRLLSQISLEFRNIIVYNIEFKTTKELIDNRRIQSTNPQINFWDTDSCILFYSTKADPKTGYFRYGATVLTGKNEGQYNFVNVNVWKNHYSFYEGFLDNSVESIAFYPPSELFVNGNLKYYDLLIKTKDKYGGTISLFETSLQYALNKPLPENLLQDTNNKGYKIDNTHFRLGSKIHIESFYYAKRVFQNSFFTTPLSFLLANYIFEYITNHNQTTKDDELKISGFTLIGYEDYSELLLSTTRSLLSKRLGEKLLITHNIFNSNSSLSRPLECIQENIFIIVPIASSFSTSVKIKNELLYIFKRNDETKDTKFTFFEPHINLILVGDLEFESKTQTENMDGFYKFSDATLNDYGWHSIDKINKIVKINEFGDIKDQAKVNEIHIRQKYFIPVYSRWNRADNCIKCFPKNIIEEKCLVETGHASISPKLIFGLPKTKPNKNRANIIDLTDSIFYGNIKKGNNRYLYYTRVGEIINKRTDKELLNYMNIKIWLENLKDEFHALPNFMNQKVVLVTPSSSTASNFIDMVNEYVFNYTANCLTISLYEDYIENSESLYADGLYKADIVIFVDDVLLTTKSFLEINYIIKYIRKKLGKGTGIDYCITLINRMAFDSEENVLLKLAKLNGNIQENLKKASEQLFYFTKINNPSIEEPNGEFPLISESKRYKILSDTSSIDSIRGVFFEKYKKLREHNLLIKKDQKSIKNEVDDTSVYNNKKLYQLLILDKLYTLFEYECLECRSGAEETEDDYNNLRSKKIDCFFLTKEDPINSDNDLNKFRKLADEIRNEFFDSENKVRSRYSTYEKVLTRYDHNLDYVILKILCSTPIIYYKQLRESAFYWFIAVLEKLRMGWSEYGIIGINNLNAENLINYFKVDGLNYYSEYQKLKFLLKRSVQLKSNYLIHKEFLESIKKLINLLYSENIYLLQKKEESEEILIKKIKELFNSQFTKGHIELYNYVVSLNMTDLLSDIRVKSLNLNKLEIEQRAAEYITPNASDPLLFDSEDPFGLEFYKAFDDIRKLTKYRLITSKKMIYDLICLTQELIYQNEPKAIKLENNIEEFKETESNKNGDFSHFLRLLKIENTAAIESFWNYFYEKEKDHDKETIEIQKIDKIEQYQNDPKFKAIDPLIKIDDKFDSFIGFLKLKAELINLEINRTGKSRIGSLEHEVKQILDYTSKIIGDNVEQCYLSVNYNYMLTPGLADIFFFDGHHVDDNIKELYSFYDKDKIALSLNYKMYSGITENCYDRYPLSNFEFIRNNGYVTFRDDTNIENKNEIAKSPELAADQNDCNILLIKISDFTYNFPHSFRYIENDKKDLVTQAVLTFKLSQSTRLDIKKLRLLLLLRSPLSKFINANILSNNMIEYINNKSNKRYQAKLGHRIDTFIRNQMTAFSEHNIEVVEILNDAIAGQTNAYSIEPNTPPLIVDAYEFEKRIITLLESRRIFITNPISSNQRSLNINIKNEYKFHKFIYKIVLTEIIINARRHGTTERPFINITTSGQYLCVKNIQENEIMYYSEGKGIEMCRDIINKSNSDLDLIVSPNNFDEDQKKFWFVVNIPLYL